MMRLRTSRPKRSVPSGCAVEPPAIQTGGISFWLMSPSVGFCGARTGARAAATTSAASTPPANHGRPRRRTLRALMADPRVEVAVEHVDEEVAREVERAQ